VTAAAAPVRRLYVGGPFGQVHVRLAAPSGPMDKPSIACFHVTPGSGRMFEAALPLLAADRTVMAFDTPGYGASDPPPAPVALGGYADALTAALSALGHGPEGAAIDVIGSATGALIAIDLATRHPRWIRRVVMSGTPAFTPGERDSFVADVERQIAARRADAAGAWVTKQLEDTLSIAGRNPPFDPHLAAFADSLLPGERWAWAELAAARFPAEDRLPRITQPVLLFLNPNPRAAATRRTPTLLKSVTVIEPPAPGSMAWQLHPDVMAGHVHQFLDAPA
jgi:pimeloyl-ACP methyl ester carboxylesterase